MYLKNFSRQILFFVRTHATLFWWICFSTFSNFRLSFFLLSVDSSFFPLFCLCLIWSITFSFSPLYSFLNFYSDISSSSYLLASSYYLFSCLQLRQPTLRLLRRRRCFWTKVIRAASSWEILFSSAPRLRLVLRRELSFIKSRRPPSDSPIYPPTKVNTKPAPILPKTRID